MHALNPFHRLQRLDQFGPHHPFEIAVDLAVFEAIREGQAPVRFVGAAGRREFQFVGDPVSVIAIRRTGCGSGGQLEQVGEFVGRDRVPFRFAMGLQHRQLDRRHACTDGQERQPILSRGADWGGIGKVFQGEPTL
jgi:hypothetical protein